tara:strand:- start:1758 stop:3158 length:1401 start_codon:yes stop_codon:yes gene_type:complete
MIRFLFLSFVLLIFNSCDFDKSHSEKGAWLGGEIINPNSNHIILSKNEKIIDTINLDINNRFLYYIDNVEKGLYNFIHHEYQMVYLEPGDSLMLRLNTIEFDESLAFTGKGADRNNFLINMFIHNELENQRMRPFYQLPVEDFLAKLDSMKNLRLKNLEKFIKRVKPCEAFHKIAMANITYDYYDKKEIYPYAHFGRNEVSNAQLPNGYYDFRKNLDYNSEDLQSYYTYYRFMQRHFDFLSFESYKNEFPYNSDSFIHISNKLYKIDSLVSLTNFKNSLLKTSIRRYIINSKNPDEEKAALEHYFNLSTDQSHKDEIKHISEASLKLMPGNTLPQLNILDFNDNRHTFSSLIKRPSIIFFWSIHSLNHLKEVHSKVDELKLKYPEFDFIGFNTNDDIKTWKQTINRYGFNKNLEFRFEETESAMEHLVINSINKVMIIDEDSKIIDNYTNLFSVKFEEQLLGILNQ